MARRSSFKTVALLMLIPIGGLVLFIAFRYVREQLNRVPENSRPTTPVVAEAVPSREPAKRPATTAAAPEEKTKRAKATPPKPGHGEIVLILDDVGFDRQPLAGAMAVDPNVNFSILPNAPNAALFAKELHAAGFQILCHLPMEPLNYPRESPGPNAIMTSMGDDEIATLTREDVAAIPHAVGVNNHMGSRATRDQRVMTAMLKALPEGMFFIDSRTTSGSVGERLARELKIKTASRQVFLDDVQSETSVRRQLASLAAAAQRDGLAIGIGHMYPVTIRVLTEDVPQLRASGYRLVRANQAVR